MQISSNFTSVCLHAYVCVCVHGVWEKCMYHSAAVEVRRQLCRVGSRYLDLGHKAHVASPSTDWSTLLHTTPALHKCEIRKSSASRHDQNWSKATQNKMWWTHTQKWEGPTTRGVESMCLENWYAGDFGILPQWDLWENSNLSLPKKKEQEQLWQPGEESETHNFASSFTGNDNTILNGTRYLCSEKLHRHLVGFVRYQGAVSKACF